MTENMFKFIFFYNEYVNKTDCYFHKMIMKIQLIMRDAICNGNKKTLTSRYPCCSLCFCKNNFELLPCEVRIFFFTSSNGDQF